MGIYRRQKWKELFVVSNTGISTWVEALLLAFAFGVAASKPLEDAGALLLVLSSANRLMRPQCTQGPSSCS